MRKINLIVIHCSATPPDMDIGASTIDKWHRDRGWDSIGYHYVIRRDGDLEKGRDESVVGAHAKGYNANSIGVCLIGGVRRESNKLIADNNFTVVQFARLRSLLSELAERYPNARIIGHRDIESGKECPSFSVRDWLTSNVPDVQPAWDSGLVRDPPAPLLQTKTVAGAMLSTTGATLEPIAATLADASQQLQPIAEFSSLIRTIGVILLLAGVALTIYGRICVRERTGV